MVWTTSGNPRSCNRCLELKDTVVGRIDESGVTLPPLHPRCRCTIMYREIEPTNPQNFIDEKIKLNIKGFGEAHKYALNPEKAPDNLGYNLGNVGKLIENIKQNVNDYEITEKVSNKGHE